MILSDVSVRLCRTQIVLMKLFDHVSLFCVQLCFECVILYEMPCDYQYVSGFYFMVIRLFVELVTVNLLGQACVKVGCVVFVIGRMIILVFDTDCVLHVVMSAVGLCV